jgi:hypothetical protein
LDTISIEVFCQAALSIAPVVPLMVAIACEIVAVPKLAKGKMPKKDEGASTTHSAEDRCADADWVIEKCWLLLSVICNVNCPPL